MIKDTGRYSKKGRKGMVLILTFIIITTLTAIVAAFLYLTSTQLKGSGYDAASHKALWLAEAGIQKAIWYLQKGGLNATGGVTTTAGMTETLVPAVVNEKYKIVVSLTAVSGERLITSTGMPTGIVDGFSRIITQTVTVKNPYQTGYGVTEGKDWNETY